MTRGYDTTEMPTLIAQLKSILLNTRTPYICIPPTSSFYDALDAKLQALLGRISQLKIETESPSEEAVYENSEELDDFLKEFALKEVR